MLINKNDLHDNPQHPFTEQQRRRVDEQVQDILFRYPSLGIFITRISRYYSRSVPTACVNARIMIINPEWISTLNDSELFGLLMHELFHVIARHDIRRANRHPELWNMAGDYVINKLLLDEGILLPSGGLINHNWSEMTVEQVYDTLYQGYEEEANTNIGNQKGEDTTEEGDNDSSSGSSTAKTGTTTPCNPDGSGQNAPVQNPSSISKPKPPDSNKGTSSSDTQGDGQANDDADQSSPAENPLEKEFDRAVKQDQHVWGQVIDLTDENHDPLSPEQLADQTADRDLDNADAQTIEQISNSIGTEAGLLIRLVPRLAPPNDPPNWGARSGAGRR